MASDGSAVGGVTIDINDPQGSQTISRNDGQYYLGNIHSGTYLVTASKAGYVTESKTITLTDSDITSDFLLQVNTFAISGIVSTQDGLPLSGVKIEVSGPVFRQMTTDRNGYYAVSELLSGTYVITASKPGFIVRTKTVVITNSDIACDFILTLYEVP